MGKPKIYIPTPVRVDSGHRDPVELPSAGATPLADGWLVHDVFAWTEAGGGEVGGATAAAWNVKAAAGYRGVWTTTREYAARKDAWTAALLDYLQAVQVHRPARTHAQRRQDIAAVLEYQPHLTDAQVAGLASVDVKTVRAVRYGESPTRASTALEPVWAEAAEEVRRRVRMARRMPLPPACVKRLSPAVSIVRDALGMLTLSGHADDPELAPVVQEITAFLVRCGVRP